MFVDTWGFKAFIDRKEPKHSEVKQLLENAWKRKDFVYTSDYIIDETLKSCESWFKTKEGDNENRISEQSK